MMRAAFLILALALHPSLLDLAATLWISNHFDPNGGAATSDAGNSYDPDGLTSDAGGHYDPNGQTTDVGNSYDPNG
jgi:hypothetical protein